MRPRRDQWAGMILATRSVVFFTLPSSSLSLSLGVCLSSSHSLSSGVFSGNALKVKPKCKWFYTSKWLFSNQSVFDFPLTVFSITAKHTQGCKMIFWKCFQAKQTQPKRVQKVWILRFKKVNYYLFFFFSKNTFNLINLFLFLKKKKRIKW